MFDCFIVSLFECFIFIFLSTYLLPKQKKKNSNHDYDEDDYKLLKTTTHNEVQRTLPCTTDDFEEQMKTSY